MTDAAPTKSLAQWLAHLSFDTLPASTVERAKHVWLDWYAVTLAGLSEPLSRILIDTYASGGQSRIIGTELLATAENAALINGATGHALDYDDVSTRMRGHPAVAVLPSVLALADEIGADARRCTLAIVAGYEVAAAIGDMMNDAHYDHGFHATGTTGSIASAAAASVLLGLNADQCETALGLGATQAAGLKAMFGTMAKPLHAGRAAMNGVMAARLAQAGFESRSDILEIPQGYGEVMSPKFTPIPIRSDPDEPYEIERALFKYHAACYMTHSTLQASHELRRKHRVDLSDIDTVTIKADAAIKRICDIETPKSGLDVKFSIRHVAVAALAGRDTANLDFYSDQTALDADLSAARAKVVFEDAIGMKSRGEAAVTLVCKGGRVLSEAADSSIPSEDDQSQWQQLISKARSIADPVCGPDKTSNLVEAISTVDTMVQMPNPCRN